VDLVNRLETETRNGRQGRLTFIVLDELGYLPFAYPAASSCSPRQPALRAYLDLRHHESRLQ
jgi:hypothetical protein